MNYHLSGVLPLHGHACGGFAHWAEHAVGMVDMVQEKKTWGWRSVGLLALVFSTCILGVSRIVQHTGSPALTNIQLCDFIVTPCVHVAVKVLSAIVPPKRGKNKRTPFIMIITFWA